MFEHYIHLELPLLKIGRALYSVCVCVHMCSVLACNYMYMYLLNGQLAVPLINRTNKASICNICMYMYASVHVDLFMLCFVMMSFMCVGNLWSQLLNMYTQ